MLTSFLPGSQVILNDLSNGLPSSSPVPESTLKHPSENIHAGQSFIQHDAIFCPHSLTCLLTLTSDSVQQTNSFVTHISRITNYASRSPPSVILLSSNIRDTSTSRTTSTSSSGLFPPLVLCLWNLDLVNRFFESRNSPKDAPLILRLNGGPGCSSSDGLLFEKLGPCSVADGGHNATFNPYSWNTHANIIFLGQPANVGFSYSKDGSNVYTSQRVTDIGTPLVLGLTSNIIVGIGCTTVVQPTPKIMWLLHPLHVDFRG